MTSTPSVRDRTPDKGPAAVASAPDLTVVIPTRNESDNIVPLVARLAFALGDTPFEIIFVDDSDDSTPTEVRRVAAASGTDVHLLHREPGSRHGGLGGAVTAGLAQARAPWVVVMDADLQHPPEVVPELLATARSVDEQAGNGRAVDAVVASRYRGQGSSAGLAGRLRRLVSRASGSLARLVFPVRLRAVTDPMSGFFAVRRSAVNPATLRPDGYKIMLEILVRGEIERVTEIPYTFQPRVAGESKASLRQGLRYLRHLAGLRLAAPGPWLRFLGFAVAGASGIAVNSALLAVLTGRLALPYLLAAFLATQATIGWNFVLIDRLVMRRRERPALRRFGRFWLLSSSAIPLHLALLAGLVQVLQMPLLPANVLAIGVVFVLRYAATSRWVYGQDDDARDPAAVPTVRRMLGRLRRAALSRVGLAVTITALAFPAVSAAMWNSLWSHRSAATLLVPLLVATALLVAQIRPVAAEPDVHDRQLDLLLAGFLLAVTGGLVVLATDRGASTPMLLAAVSFLGAGVVLLLGTRTAARLRWAALVLPVAAVDAATPRSLDDAMAWVVGQAAAVLSLPFSDELEGSRLAVGYRDQTLVLSNEAIAAVPLTVALCCLVLAGLSTMPVRRLLRRLPLALLGVTAAAVTPLCLAMAAGAALGPTAMHIALLPLVLQTPVAITVVAIVWRWSSAVVLPRVNGAYHMPRGRVAAAVLVVLAVVLGLVSPPVPPAVGPSATIGLPPAPAAK